ncbi:MAG: hypothetical protein LBV27_07165 [Oscillospiraceae bacterium]|jgi:hypothetical protein|nr:hypothetical protein [Oscillospiraceae bacterium]
MRRGSFQALSAEQDKYPHFTLDFLRDINYTLGVTESEVKMSPKTGRPKADKPKDIRYSIRLDAETEMKLINYCKKHAITKGEAIRKGIRLLLSKEK